MTGSRQQTLKSDAGEFIYGAPRSFTAAAEVFIRIFPGPDRQAADNPLTAENALMYMLADLVVASRGTPLTRADNCLMTKFSDLLQACTAAKRLQLGILQFAQLRPQQVFGAGIVIQVAGENLPSDFSAAGTAQASPLLEHVDSGQILFSDAAYREIQEIPGLRFRSTSTASDSRIPGAQEMVWMPVQTSPQLRVSSQTRATIEPATAILSRTTAPTQGFRYGSSVGATVPISSGKSETYQDGAPPGSGGGESEGQQHGLGGNPTAWFRRSGTSSAANRDRDLGVDELAELANPPSHSFLYLAGGAVVVVALAFAIYSYRRNPVISHPAVLRPAIAPETMPVPSPPTRSVSTPPAGVGSVAPAAKLKAAVIAHPSSPSPASAEPKRVPEKVTSGDFSLRDVPGLLRKAEEDAGAGEYEAARREYGIVLQLDPNNAEARQGLHRLNLSESEAAHDN